jgi:spermidine/putrescine transport system ATP-binding protein
MDYMVQLKGVTKRFGSFVAVQDVSLDIEGGEFLTLLGPSGCGKTTLLRMISGFETPTEGTIYLSGQDVTHLPPYKRDVNQVFQSYALFPHLTVADNIAFGLKMKKVPKPEIEERVKQVTQLVSLTGFEQRKPSQLSGGQRQRVALARAIVCQPRVLLLDEPLAALDAKLRHAMQIELKHLQRKVGITFVFVTHDQEEALTMSDRIAVMSNGQIEQLGTPTQVYEEPATAYVADFLGVSNLMDAEASGSAGDGGCNVKIGDFNLVAKKGKTDAKGPVKCVIRPERVRIGMQDETGENRVPGMIERMVYLGASSQVIVRLPQGDSLQVLIQNQGDTQTYHQGTPISVFFPPEALRVVPADTGGKIADDLQAVAAEPGDPDDPVLEPAEAPLARPYPSV